jgi:hypothetical protein
VIAAAVLLLTTGGGAGDCVALLQSSTVSVEKAVALFESKPGNSAEALLTAREVLARAQVARDRLEAEQVSAFCAPSRSEELIYLNHLTLGFTGWIAARARRPPREYDLASIIRRARTHRARGRSRLQ